MPRTPEQNREYMRRYRAVRKVMAQVAAQTPDQALDEARRFATDYATLYNDTARERDALIEEVRHLKEELAKRPLTKASAVLPYTNDQLAEPPYNSRPFTPVPKKR